MCIWLYAMCFQNWVKIHKKFSFNASQLKFSETVYFFFIKNDLIIVPITSHYSIEIFVKVRFTYLTYLTIFNTFSRLSYKVKKKLDVK